MEVLQETETEEANVRTSDIKGVWAMLVKCSVHRIKASRNTAAA